MSVVPQILRWIKRYKYHILVWLVVLFLIPLTNPLLDIKVYTPLIALLTTIGHIVVFYAVSMKIYPILFRGKRYFIGASCLIIVGVLYVLSLYSLWFGLPYAFNLAYLRMLISQYLYLLTIGVGYYLHCNSEWRTKRNEELMNNQLLMVEQHMALEQKQIKLQQELLFRQKSFLNSQYNEHTLFNFLNHLYSKVYDIEPEAGEAITIFSDFLSFSLEVQFGEPIPVAREIEYIEDYLNMQKCLKENISVKFIKKGKVDNLQIFPFILFPFVENAFKHGISDDPNYPIEISLEVNGQVDFSVYNQKRKDTQLKASGIGFNNLRQMLEVYYPGCYSLDIVEGDDAFRTALSLSLKN